MKSPDLKSLYDEIVPLQNKRGRNDRFAYAKVSKSGKSFFLKTALRGELVSNIQREVVWVEFMNRVDAFYPQAHFLGPTIERRIGTTGLVFNYIDAPSVAESDDLKKWQGSLPRYAEMLVTFDTVAINWKSENLPDEPSRSDRIYALWQEWLGDNIGKVPDLDAARKMVEAVNFKLTRCLQHGDLGPWQIFDTGKSWIVYDGEKCGTDLFRFTDLAYSYGWLYTKLQSPDTARQLLQLFIEGHTMKESELMKVFLPVLTHHAVGMLADAYNDVPVSDYVEEATQLLNACVEHDLEHIKGA